MPINLYLQLVPSDLLIFLAYLPSLPLLYIPLSKAGPQRRVYVFPTGINHFAGAIPQFWPGQVGTVSSKCLSLYKTHCSPIHRTNGLMSPPKDMMLSWFIHPLLIGPSIGRVVVWIWPTDVANQLYSFSPNENTSKFFPNWDLNTGPHACTRSMKSNHCATASSYNC